MDVHDRFRLDVATSPRGRLTQISLATGVPDSTLYDLIAHPSRRLSYDNAKALAEFYSGIDAALAKQAQEGAH